MIERKEAETETEFNSRKAQAESQAGAERRQRRDEEAQVKNPSDEPLAKFARVWDSDYKAPQTFLKGGDGGH